MREYAIPIGSVLAILGLFLSYQSHTQQATTNREVLALEREILELERDIFNLVNINQEATTRSIAMVIESVDDLNESIESLQDHIDTNAEKDREASNRNVDKLTSWLRAGCFASANGSDASREHCIDVDR